MGARFLRGLPTCLSFLASVTLFAEGDNLVGHVTGFEGKWRDQSCQCRFDQGYMVSSKSRIVRESPANSKDRLKIRLSATGEEVLFQCAQMDCRDSLDVLGHLPKKKKRTALGQFLQAAEEVWHENTPGGGGHVHTISAYARTLSRGPTDIPISDAIVPLRDGRAEFSAVFAGVGEGTYLVDLFAVDPTGKAACLDLPTPQELHWKWDQRTMLTPNSIRAGVYELFLCQRLGERVLRRESAIVLVANGKRWANRMRAEYQKFSRLMEGWDPREVSMLQHAYLHHLDLKENR